MGYLARCCRRLADDGHELRTLGFPAIVGSSRRTQLMALGYNWPYRLVVQLYGQGFSRKHGDHDEVKGYQGLTKSIPNPGELAKHEAPLLYIQALKILLYYNGCPVIRLHGKKGITSL